MSTLVNYRGRSRLRDPELRYLELNPDSPFYDGLVGCWLMGAQQHWDSGTWVDLSPFNNHGTLEPTLVDNWIHYDGRQCLGVFTAGQKVDLDRTISFPGAHTFSCWVNASGNDELLFSGNTAIDKYVLYFTAASGGARDCYYRPGGFVLLGNIAWTNNQWYHVCLRRTADNTVELYRDGVLQFTDTKSGTLDIDSFVAYPDGTRTLRGRVDAFLLHNRALAAEEIHRLYEETKGGSYGSLVKSTRTSVFIPEAFDPVETLPNIITTGKSDPAPPIRRLELNPDSPFYDGLVGCWLMGAQQHWGSAKLLDLSQYNNHMTWRGGPSFTGDEFSPHVWCNTDSQYADSSYNGLGASGQSFTVGIWYRNGAPSGIGNRFIVSNYVSGGHNGFFAIGTETEAGMFVWLRNTGKATIAKTAEYGPAWDDEWHHYLFTRDIGRGEVRFHIDGVLKETVVTTSTNAARDSDSFIGLIRHNNNTSQTAHGRVHQVSAWDRALTTAEVAQFYQETRDGSYGSLVKPVPTKVFLNVPAPEPTIEVPHIITSKKSSSPRVLQGLELNPDSPFYDGLVGCWLMGNHACRNSNKLLDLSPYGNHGDLTNMDPATDWVHDGERAGLDFDGSNDYVSIPHHSSIDVAAGPFTISCWHYAVTGATADAASLVSMKDAGGQYEGYALRYPSAAGINKYDCHLNHSAESWITSNGTYDPNVWRNVVWTYDGNTTWLYVDGIEDRSVAMSPPTSAVSSNLNVGRSTWDTTQIYNGLIDDVRIYNRTLTAAEVRQLYEETKDGSYGSLVKPRKTRAFLPLKTEPQLTAVPYIITRSKTGSPGYSGTSPTSRVLELNPDSPFYDGLVGCWLMGNYACRGSNKLLDLSPYGNHGDLTNMDPATDWVHDGERAGLDFDGVDDYVTCGTPSWAWNNERFTMCCHVWVSSSVSFHVHFVTWSDAWSSTMPWQFVRNSGGGIRLERSGSSAAFSDLPSFDQWHKLVCVYDSGVTRLYVDGSLTGTSTGFTPGSNFANGLYFGSRNGAELLLGKLDDIRIYNRALTAAEVRQLYEETRDGSYGSLVKQVPDSVWLESDLDVRAPYFRHRKEYVAKTYKGLWI